MPKRAICAILILTALTMPLAGQAQNPFINMVAIGDSLAAGSISGSGLIATGQQNSFIVRVARQVSSFLFLPLVAEPGIPNELQLVQPGFPPVLGLRPGTSSGRVSPLVIPNNLAVPGHTLRDAIFRRPDLPIDSATDLVLGLPSLVIPGSAPVASQLEMAEFLRPAVAVVWIGNNDALGAALGGRSDLLTPLDRFSVDYNILVQRLKAVQANLILINIPDVTAIAALMPVGVLAQAAGLPAAVVATRLGVQTSDFLILSHIDRYLAIVTGRQAGPVSDELALSTEEILTIRQRIVDYNNVIRAAAIASQSLVVDIHSRLNDLRDNGLTVGTKRLTTQFLGGLFSLDGFHPTYTGHAVIANEVLGAINRGFGTNFPLVNLSTVMAADPLVF